jgi:hypothetical protein
MKYQQSVAEFCFALGFRFWERDKQVAVGREVDREVIKTEGPAAGRTGDDILTGARPSLGTGGPTPHLVATGPVSSDAGARAHFGRFGTVVSADFCLVPLVSARG